MRSYQRHNADLRPITFEPHFTQHAEGSCLIKMGATWVLTTATIEEKVPRWLEKKDEGWLTAEYAMLPRATHERVVRESMKGRPGGRTLEIQRLIGRSLRACLDFKKLGPRTIIIDCDVLQADGGTRTASINGGYVALSIAINKLLQKGTLKENPIIDTVSAISLGMKNGEILTDLDYQEDSSCDVDVNVVMLGQEQLIEIQGTGENATFSVAQTNDMLGHATVAIAKIRQQQLTAL
ncbi:MAG: ribonuclease PH [Bdellovibrionota bacterium]